MTLSLASLILIAILAFFAGLFAPLILLIFLILSANIE